MKTMIWTLLFWMGITLNAASQLVTNDEAGVSVEIPDGFEKSWQVAHTDSNAHFDVYQCPDEPEFVLVLGTMPIQDGHENEIGCLCPFVFEQMQTVFGGCDSYDDDFHFELDLLNFKNSSNLPVTSYRLSMMDDFDDEIGPVIDFHVLVNEGQIFVALVAMCAEDYFDYYDEKDLTEFSASFVKGISLAKAS